MFSSIFFPYDYTECFSQSNILPKHFASTNFWNLMQFLITFDTFNNLLKVTTRLHLFALKLWFILKQNHLFLNIQIFQDCFECHVIHAIVN